VGRFISWLILIPTAAAAIAFAVSNRVTAPLDLWPFPYVIELPVFALVLGGGVAGFVIGGLVAWLSGGRARRRARQAEGRADRAERDHEQTRLRLSRAEDEARRAREQETTSEAQLPAPVSPRDAA